MKKIFLSIIITILYTQLNAQLKVEAGASWVGHGNPTIVLQDMNLINNGLFSSGTGTVKFTGFQNSTISGSSPISLYMMDIAKTNSAKVMLNHDIGIDLAVNFVSGQLDLNGNNISLSASGYISGETELNRITGNNGGYIEIGQNIGTPNMANPGNLGAFISSTANIGVVTVRRGHTPQNGAGLPNSINRYYALVPSNNTNLNATLRLKYFDAELNGQTETGLVMYQSNDAGGNWNNLSQTSRSANSNYVEKTGINSFGLQTLANDVQTTNGVTGLVFTGQRKKSTEVQLKWTSQTETNMAGYQLQRKLDTEQDFSDLVFINTLAPGGNSISPLGYEHIDANAHTGHTYYRLKMMAADNSFVYSQVISVAGKTKGKGGGNNNLTLAESEESATAKVNTTSLLVSKKITVGPNPNNGNFWFSVKGLERETIATLFTLDGKQVKQFRVANPLQQQVNGIRTGIYLLKIPGFETQKIIVNGGGSNSPAAQPVFDNSLKF